MRNIILAIVGIAVAAAGAVYLARLLYLKKTGETVDAEVIDAEMVRKGRRTGSYTHTLRYCIGGRKYESRDKAGYSQPMEKGSVQQIVCDPKHPERFKFSQDISRHITITAALIAMAAVFALRFGFAYMK